MPSAAIDLFCGVGGLTKGLERAGINVVAGIDFEINCQFAYEENNNARFLCKDITTVSPAELQELYPPNTDVRILAGCAPCQPFSKAGYWVTNKKRNSNDDPRNLLKPYFKLLGELKPDGFLLENVESILHPSNKEAIDTIYNEMLKLGKTVLYQTAPVMFDEINDAKFGRENQRSD